MEQLANAPRKRYQFIPRSFIPDSDKERAWVLSDGRFLGFRILKNGDRITLFTGPTEMLEDAPCQFTFQTKDWECFTKHCEGLEPFMKTCENTHPDSTPYYVSIAPCEPSGHYYGLKISRFNGSVITNVAMLDMRFEPPDNGGYQAVDSLIKLKWNDWKENMSKCCAIAKRVLEDVDKVKSLEKLKIRLNDYFESLTDVPFAKQPEHEIDIVYITTVGSNLVCNNDVIHVLHHSVE